MSALGIAARLTAAARDRGVVRTAVTAAAWGGRWVTGSLRPAGPGRPFVVDGREHREVHHRYHYTWLNERAVEVALAGALLDEHDPARVLEVGHVLGHYRPVRHTVVDRYERADGVRNVDVLDVRADRPYDLVLCVSTLEHVGFDEPGQEPDPAKAVEVVRHLRSLLAPHGRLWVTVPVGYNPGLDARLRDGALGLVPTTALRRDGGRWRQVPPAEAWGVPYDHLLMTAGAVVVAEATGPA